MKAVFLDRGTFSKVLDLPKPDGIDEYEVYDATVNDKSQILQRCHDADIIITNKVVLTSEIISSLPKLKLIALTATGKNNVDENACQNHGIVLQNVEGYSVDSVPEHTFMLMLTAMRAGRYYHDRATDGTWQNDGRFCLLDEPIYDLAGRVLGIIGRGAIGLRVGEIAKAFGMTVLFAEHQDRPIRDERYTSFLDVLARSDVLSLHCPLTTKTHHLINHDTIAKMHKKPLIVNVARGAVVDAKAIIKAINDDKILGYASDVFEDEPFVHGDEMLGLKNHPRVHFTPHNAWGSLSAQKRLWRILSQQVTDFIKNH